MKIATAWLVLCAAALATGVGANVQASGLSTLDALQTTSAGFPEFTQATNEFDALVARRLNGMASEASTTDDAALQKQARAFFNLYKKVDPTTVATWGTTDDLQFESFYTKVFPKILAKGKALRAAAKANRTTISTTKNADGSTTVVRSDGSVTVTKADGSSVTTEVDGTITTVKADGTTTVTKATVISTTKNADGSTTVVRSNGSVTVTKADGSSVTTSPDGIVTTIKADGTTSVTQATVVSTTKNADGSTTVVRSNGSITVTKADGSSVTTSADGIITTTKADGTTTATQAAVISTTKNADGSTTVVRSNGSITVTKADGSSVTTSADGIITTTKADGTTTATQATVTSTTKNADGSTTVTKSDGSTTITKADGTTVTTRSDGSTITTKSDGTSVLVTKDGTTQTTAADGSSVTTKTDGTTTITKADGQITTTAADGTVTTTATDGTVTTKNTDGTTTVTTPNGTTTVTNPDGTTTVTTASPSTSTTPSSGGATTPSSGTTSGGTTTTPGTTSGTTTTPGTSSTSTGLTVKSQTDAVQVADSLSFLNQIYDEDLAKSVRALRDNTNNIETIVESAKGSSTDAANQYQAPTVLEGINEPTALGRRLASGSGSGSSKKVDVLFCDIAGNAIWKWSADADPMDTGTTTTTTNTTITIDADLCKATEVTVKVSAYQSGCSRQNHPEGCDNVYYKGCGGLTANPSSNQILVARTGGRSLGLLSYKDLGGGQVCQGRVVDFLTTYRGKRFNSPSYAEYTQAGHLFFTDSPFGLATSAADFEGDTLDNSPLREIPFNGVYLLQNNGTTVELVDCFMDRPNKIAFSPKQDVMYITNSRKGNSYVKQFALQSDGTVGNSSMFFNFTAHPELKTDEGYADGIKADEDGNVYVAVHKGVYILSPKGVLIGTLLSSQPLSALAFGDGRMFVTGAFGVVAQSSGVLPSVPPSRAKTDC